VEVTSQQHKGNKMRKYCEIQNGTIYKYNVTRKQYGIGENSPESACVSKGLYLIIDNPVAYNRALETQSSTYTIDEPNKQVNRVYTNTAIPQEVLINKLSADIERGVQNHIDTQAQTLGFDDINSISKFMGYENTYRTSAESLGAWCALCSDQVEVIKQRQDPDTTVDSVVAELPDYAV